MTTISNEEKTFADLGLSAELQKACLTLRWIRPTAIQILAIPPALEGRNLVALAETGSGKTAAYALPIVQKLLESPHSHFALVLAPTRELAAQVHSQFNALGKSIGVSTGLLVGGVPITQQADQMRIAPPHILVATPGRLIDHMKRTKGFDEIRFSKLRFLVLDEADRMLGSDFDSVLEKIVSLLPPNRQTFLFSATMTNKIGKLQRASVRDPVFVSTRKSKFQALASLRQYVHLVPHAELDTYLVHLLRMAFSSEPDSTGLDRIRLYQTTSVAEEATESVMPTSAIVFTRTRSASNHLNLLLRQFLPQPVIALNGDMAHAQRLGALNKFRQSQGSVLVATDVASRGLDIPQVGLVVNYDVPLDAKTYVHRVGRTARAGRTGCALTLLTQYSAVFFIKEIEAHLLSSVTTEQEKIPALVEPGSETDLALETAVAELNGQVKEASARSTQALSAIQRRLNGRARKSVTSVGDIQTPSTDSVLYKPGLKRTAWASQAPTYKRNEIIEVMQAISMQPSEQTCDSECNTSNRTVLSKRPRKFRREAMVSAHRHTKVSRTGKAQKLKKRYPNLLPRSL